MPPVDGHSTVGEVNPADHGSGPVEISLPGMPTEIDNRVITQASSLGAHFPFNIDLQSGNAVGVGEHSRDIKYAFELMRIRIGPIDSRRRRAQQLFNCVPHPCFEPDKSARIDTDDCDEGYFPPARASRIRYLRLSKLRRMLLVSVHRFA